MASIAEKVLESAPRRPSVEQVAGLMEADLAAKQQGAERAVRERKRQERIAREQERRRAAAKGERQHDSAAAGIAAIAKAVR